MRRLLRSVRLDASPKSYDVLEIVLSSVVARSLASDAKREREKCVRHFFFWLATLFF